LPPNGPADLYFCPRAIATRRLRREHSSPGYAPITDVTKTTRTTDSVLNAGQERIPGGAAHSPAAGLPDEVEFGGNTGPADRTNVSRRAVLGAGLASGVGAATVPVIALADSLAKSPAMPQPSNVSYPLNSGWLFGGVYQAGTEAAQFDDSGFASVTIPHNAAGLSWRNWRPPAWEQVWIYRRHFTGASLLTNSEGHPANNRVFVDFDGVMVNASVVCNGQVVGQHQGGYLPFSVELTGQLSKGDNVLSVIVDSRCLAVPPIVTPYQPSSIDYLQPGGIYRDVTVRVVPEVYVADLFALPQDVLSHSPTVSVECAIDSGTAITSDSADTTLLVELISPSGATVASRSVALTINQQGLITANVTLAGLGSVSLWSVASPTLYTVQATLNVPGIGVSTLTRQIGFREASFQPDGFYLNGQRLQLFGLDRHQLFPYTGMAMPARVQRRDAQILKNEFNCNMVRCSHYPQSPAFLDACDQLGLLVWEEAPGWDHVSSSPQWQAQVVQNVTDMVTRDRSRPSVVIWGTRLNETGDYPSLWPTTRAAARQLDPSRPSAGAMDRHSTDGWDEDVFAFNDYTVSDGNAALLPPLPGVPYLVTESVGIMENEPPHFTWTDPPAVLARQAALHAQAQNAASSDINYAGLLAWACFDYSSMHDGTPWSVKWAGVADGFRVPKPGAAMYQTQLSPQSRPVIVPAFFWEPGGAQPAGQPLLIASNCDQLEIFVGGVHTLTALPADDNPLYRNLAYPPFILSLPHLSAPADLRVQGYVNGQSVVELNMSADPARDYLNIESDDSLILADGSDMTRMVFRAVDAYGNQRRYGEGEVTLALSGPGELVGDNPFAFGEYGGLGAVWVRSMAGRPGTISVTAVHPALGAASTQIQTQWNGSADVPL